ncbi:MAG TPA: LytR C-terminal domain-containing protein [Flexivirga sp.]|uniref:LytR C-terminal domain-containing protein n=1 Tax=Flexivirga sp. TaxID=1962927 RepID=UPI002C4DF14C|nr:LytR C-terminal domain-containing protein [Flexivirga sp.]HWC22155.1 LytR C-terminal domain-containing protein [Flexivirga sp.]
MSYVRGDGGLAEARRRKHRRSMIVIAVAVAMVLGAFLYAVTYMDRHGEAAPTASSSCDVTPTPPPQSIFVLNVYNASDRSQAKQTGIAMKSHGFNVGTVSNDPYKERLKGIGQIRFGPNGKKNATEFVKKYLPGAQLVEDGRTDDSVDVVLGDAAPAIQSAPPTTSTPPPGCSA